MLSQPSPSRFSRHSRGAPSYLVSAAMIVSRVSTPRSRSKHPLRRRRATALCAHAAAETATLFGSFLAFWAKNVVNTTGLVECGLRHFFSTAEAVGLRNGARAECWSLRSVSIFVFFVRRSVRKTSIQDDFSATHRSGVTSTRTMVKFCKTLDRSRVTHLKSNPAGQTFGQFYFVSSPTGFGITSTKFLPVQYSTAFSFSTSVLPFPSRHVFRSSTSTVL